MSKVARSATSSSALMTRMPAPMMRLAFPSTADGAVFKVIGLLGTSVDL